MIFVKADEDRSMSWEDARSSDAYRLASVRPSGVDVHVTTADGSGGVIPSVATEEEIGSFGGEDHLSQRGRRRRERRNRRHVTSQPNDGEDEDNDDHRERNDQYAREIYPPCTAKSYGGGQSVSQAPSPTVETVSTSIIREKKSTREKTHNTR